MQHYGYVHQALNSGQTVEIQPGLPFVLPVSGTDSHSQASYTGLFHKIAGLFGIGIGSFTHMNVILGTAYLAQFSLHRYPDGPGNLQDLFGRGDVFFQGQLRAAQTLRK